MTFLVPIDGSDSSFRALEFAVELADRFDDDLRVVHVTEYENEATEELLDRAHDVLEGAGVDADVDVVTDFSDFRGQDEVGNVVLDLCEREGYDHVVMGHYTGGTLERAILGSATETVIESEQVRVTVVP